MSKLSKTVKRFQNVRIGADVRELDSAGKLMGDDTRPLIRITGLKGKATMQFMDLIDGGEATAALRFIVLTVLQEDDPTTTEADFDEHLEMIDMINIANIRTELSGLGTMFDFDSKKKSVQLESNQQSANLPKDSFHKEFREKVANGSL